MRRYRSLAVICLFLVSCTSGPRDAARPIIAAVDSSETKTIRNDVTYLASDSLEGRGVGLTGLDRAADFIASRYAHLGLHPVEGDDGFFQPFSYTLSSTVGPKTTFAINGNPLTLAKEFTPLPLSAATSFSAPLVFVGYGIIDAERHYDDYAGIDVHGKIAVAFRYEPHNATGGSRFTNTPDWSEQSGLLNKANNAAARGAIALILVNPPTFHGIDLLLSPTMLHAPHASIPVLQVKQFQLMPFLDLKSKQQQIDQTLKPSSQNIAAVVASGTIDFDSKLITVKNVVAALPGYGPHADEYVVVGAHYDHLGRGGPGSLTLGSRQIHHGADDNASGTAAVLAIASRLAAAGRLDRSVLFVNFTAEEEGLIGSGYFVNHTPVPLEKIVAMINLDMVGRVRGEQLFVGGTGTDRDFDSFLATADNGLPLRLKKSGPYVGRGGFGPSDHMSFAMHDIPVLFLFSGMHADYHRPTDTAEKLNYPDLENVVTLTHRLISEIVVAPREPYDATHDSPSALAELFGRRANHAHHALLGIIPDPDGDAADGVRISTVLDHSPAAAAGLQKGDLLQTIDGTKLDSLYDLQDFLAAAKPNTRVLLEYVRGKNISHSEVTLGGE